MDRRQFWGKYLPEFYIIKSDQLDLLRNFLAHPGKFFIHSHRDHIISCNNPVHIRVLFQHFSYSPDSLFIYIGAIHRLLFQTVFFADRKITSVSLISTGIA